MLAVMLCTACCLVSACGKQPLPPEPYPTEIVLDYSDVKTEFEYGEAFTYAGLKIEVIMDSGERLPVQLGSAKVKPPQMTPGQHMVEVVYGELTKKYPIYVNDIKKPFDDAVLMKITGKGVFTAQAEKIDLAKCQTAPADENAAFVKRTNSALVGGGEYLTNFSVKDNCVGFAFTSDKDYSDITLAFRFGNFSDSALTLSESVKIYCNFAGSLDTGELDISSAKALPSGHWITVAVSGVSVNKGENNIIIEVIGDKAPVLDCVKAVVSTPAHVDCEVGLSADESAVLEAELCNTEKLVNDKTVASENNLAACQPFVTEYDSDAYVSGFVSGSEFSAVLTTEQEKIYAVEMKAQISEGYSVEENWQFYIDDCLLTDVAKPQSGQSSVNLGEYKLSAGQHLFRARLVGESCPLDNFTFAAAATQDTEKPVIEDNKDKDFMVYANGTYKAEAEKMLDRSGWKPQFGTVDAMVESWYHQDGSKGVCVSKAAQGTVMRISFDLKHRAKFSVKAKVCKSGSETINPTDFATNVSGTAMKWSTSDTFGKSDATNWWKWGTLDYAPLLLDAGEYVLSVNVTDVGVDWFELIFEEPLDVSARDYGIYKVEAEELFDRSGWKPQFGAVDEMIESWWHNDGSKGNCVGKVAKDTVIRITFELGRRAKLTFSARVCRNSGMIGASDITTKIGENVLTWRTTDTFGHTDATNYWNWGTVNYDALILDEGRYVMEITTVDVGYDYFTLKFSDPEADLTIDEYGTYRFEAEDMFDKSGWKAQSGNTVAQMIEKWTWKDGSSGYCVGKVGDGTVYRITLILSKPMQLTMKANICRDGGDIWQSNFATVVNGETVKWTKEDASNTFGKDEEKNWWNWGTVIYPTLSLEAGRVTIEITTTKLPVSFDWMEFVASEPVQA